MYAYGICIVELIQCGPLNSLTRSSGLPPGHLKIWVILLERAADWITSLVFDSHNPYWEVQARFESLFMLMASQTIYPVQPKPPPDRFLRSVHTGGRDPDNQIQCQILPPGSPWRHVPHPHWPRLIGDTHIAPTLLGMGRGRRAWLDTRRKTSYLLSHLDMAAEWKTGWLQWRTWRRWACI